MTAPARPEAAHLDADPGAEARYVRLVRLTLAETARRHAAGSPEVVAYASALAALQALEAALPEEAVYG